MVTWFDLVAAWATVEAFLGWLPCLALHASHRRCIPTQESIQHVRRQLADFGLPLPPCTVLPFSHMVHVLDAFVAFLRRFDDSTLQGPWWHGHTLPCVERRVAIRYRRQAPPRRWGSSVRGSPISLPRLAAAFPRQIFRPAIEFLEEHGRQFHLHRVKARRYSDYSGHVEGMLIEVTSLYCVVAGFEVMLRTTAAHAFDPAESQSSTSSDTLG